MSKYNNFDKSVCGTDIRPNFNDQKINTECKKTMGDGVSRKEIKHASAKKKKKVLKKNPDMFFRNRT